METAAEGALSPVTAFALVGALGVGAQWLAWRLRMPGIVLMLIAGLLAGPVLGLFEPDRDLGPLVEPMISLAVAVILFEGGLTLNLRSLSDRAEGVRRLVLIGAPLGWLLSSLCLRWGAGLSWESSAVLGGIMIVTGPTVIAPMLRTARLARRPAALLQWEAIVNDPLGALAAVLAFDVVLVMRTATEIESAALELILGVGFALLAGAAGGYGLAYAFRRGQVPEYMKVAVLFAVLLVVFAASDAMLHESGLLAVTVMGIVIANADLQSYMELRRFKEHATVLLVSGVFILLAASLDFSTLAQLDWRALIFVAAAMLLARPITAFASLAGSTVPWRERLLIALTGPRGVVMMAVAGLFGERLRALGVEDAGLIGPLGFVLVAATVVVHGFTLGPFAQALGLTASGTPGVLIIGGSHWALGLAEALRKAEIPVLITDLNRSRLRAPREAGIPIFFGDILSKAAEYRLELQGYGTAVAATDNDAYNTLVATDLGREFGRENIYQVARENAANARYALPVTLGGCLLGDGATFGELNRRMWQGWSFGVTAITEEYTLNDWRAERPEAVLIGTVSPAGAFGFTTPGETDEDLKAPPGTRLIAMLPPKDEPGRVAAAAAAGSATGPR